MEITKIEIPQIKIKEIDIPKIRRWEVHRPTLDIILKPVVDIPACVDAHRNNLPSLIGKDEKGTYQACGTFDIPSFEPLEYNPNNFVYTAPITPQNQQLEEITAEQPKIPNKKKEKIKIEPCPPQNAQFREGDYRNDKKIERLIKYERSTDGSCDPIWERVPFRESFIGTPQVLISTTVLGVVAGGSALLAPLIKKVISEIFKKIKKQLTNNQNKLQ
tara:strand:- start:43 stop:693 length:651 start_codon:yes stop_codon:yes gene_type:complete